MTSSRDERRANDLEVAARRLADASGTDRRTSFFIGAVQHPGSIIHRLQDFLKESPERAEELLAGFVSERYVDHFDRRRHGLRRDISPLHALLSQGYKRGQTWRGVPLGKTCWDTCIYQQLIQELRPRTVLELGTGRGGSALFFLDQCRLFGLDARVLTLDINKKDVSRTVLAEKGIEFIEGDVVDLDQVLPIRLLRSLPHPWLVIEDTHVEVPRIVKHLERAMHRGDYLVVEDIPASAGGSFELRKALVSVPRGTFLVDTFYTDMFGRNLTCAPDAIFKKFGGTAGRAPRSARSRAK